MHSRTNPVSADTVSRSKGIATQTPQGFTGAVTNVPKTRLRSLTVVQTVSIRSPDRSRHPKTGIFQDSCPFCRTPPSFLHSNLTVFDNAHNVHIASVRQERASGSLQLIKRFQPDRQASSSDVVFMCCRLLGHGCVELMERCRYVEVF